MFQVEKIKSDLKKRLSEYRYCHSLRVAEVARKLAQIYHVDEEKAYIAGLVHDIAKEFSEEENRQWISKFQIEGDLLTTEFKQVIHAEIGAIVAKELYGVDEEIVLAIRYHAIGNIKMKLLDKIVFVADKIEEGKDYPGIEEERILAYQNIDEALILCLKNQKKKRELEGKNIHPDSLQLLDYLEKNCLLFEG